MTSFHKVANQAGDVVVTTAGGIVVEKILKKLVGGVVKAFGREAIADIVRDAVKHLPASQLSSGFIDVHVDELYAIVINDGRLGIVNGEIVLAGIAPFVVEGSVAA